MIPLAVELDAGGYFYLSGQAICTYCAGVEECYDDCPLSDDFPDEYDRMVAVREFLSGLPPLEILRMPGPFLLEEQINATPAPKP